MKEPWLTCPLTAKARDIAIEAHSGQFRRDGVTPYVTHPQSVAENVSELAAPVALLHDVIEDNPKFTAETLKQIGIPDYVVEAVVLLTKIPNEDYFTYIQNVKINPLSREVKIADIKHNLSPNPKPEAVEKYKMALKMLAD